ncbi:hypothetical protein KP77_12550 [Jeotgalibacillus alimentarius]|uniref:Uncharacterized protein n=1 Tax=Jeotgalibacillus alimentarius TaxID=135826 RepID=A0A0C2W6S4_9BACL|nr:hypothetical protein [Jeotgalibacillus alimentarius]KIL51743.1 hypothetical protein KP77_12550 [Jeotgalibacillus alimentarius]
MKRWREKKAARSQKRKDEGRYNFLDVLTDVLIWVPELVILPFRLIYLLFRLFGRVFKDGFDSI